MSYRFSHLYSFEMKQIPNRPTRDKTLEYYPQLGMSTERLLTNQTRCYNVYLSQVPTRYPRDVHVRHKVAIYVYDFLQTPLWFQLLL
jgi:hypothetical protein